MRPWRTGTVLPTSRPSSPECAHDRGVRTHQAVRTEARRRRSVVRRRRRQGHRLPGSQRRRQVDDDADDPRFGPSHGRVLDDQREAPVGHAPRHAGGRRAPRRRLRAPDPQGLRPPLGAGRVQPHPEAAGGRGHRAGRPRRRRRPTGRPVLPRHAPAARPRRLAPRRPGHAPLRRAGERTGPGGRALAARLLQVLGDRGQDRARLEPPLERDAAHGGRPGRHRSGPAAVRRLRRRLHDPVGPALGPRPQPAGAEPGRVAPAAGRGR